MAKTFNPEKFGKGWGDPGDFSKMDKLGELKRKLKDAGKKGINPAEGKTKESVMKWRDDPVDSDDRREISARRNRLAEEYQNNEVGSNMLGSLLASIVLAGFAGGVTYGVVVDAVVQAATQAQQAGLTALAASLSGLATWITSRAISRRN